MTTQPKRTVAFALCGSFCSFSAVLPQVRLLAARGWDVLPILSASAAGQDTRFGTAAALRQTLYEVTGHKPLTTLQGVEPLGPQKLADALVIAPATGTTMALLASGISSTPVTLAAKSLLRGGRPIVIAPSTNDGPAFAAATLLFCALRPGRQLQKAVQLKERFYPSARHPGSRPARRADTTDAVVICGRAGGI